MLLPVVLILVMIVAVVAFTRWLGWEYMVFGVAAVIASIGGWFTWIGLAVAVVQAYRMLRRWWYTRSLQAP